MKTYRCFCYFLNELSSNILPNLILLNYTDPEDIIKTIQRNHPAKILKLKIFTMLDASTVIKVHYYYTAPSFAFYSSSSYTLEELNTLTRS